MVQGVTGGWITWEGISIPSHCSFINDPVCYAVFPLGDSKIQYFLYPTPGINRENQKQLMLKNVLALFEQWALI